ncbi:hypothetical protein [Aliiroseovarius crassostreae]|uniref:hypothetical protein n=1 Tax=Aliiroseovarius crassostreae TaxID=154981 RepID=UPI003C7E2B05
MGDVLKDFFEATNNRIRSPFIGSIIFVFLVVNWRPLFNLLFGDTEVLVRIAHFDNVTTWQSLYLWPVVGGVVFALANPWLKYAGAWVAKKPVAHLKQLQDEAAHQHQIADIRRATELEERRAAEEEARERRKIDAAKREKEAEEVGGEELSRELKDPSSTIGGAPLSKLAEQILKDTYIGDPQTIELFKEGTKDRIRLGGVKRGFSTRMAFVEAEDAVRDLAKRGYVNGENPWYLSPKGSEYVTHSL